MSDFEGLTRTTKFFLEYFGKDPETYSGTIACDDSVTGGSAYPFNGLVVSELNLRGQEIERLRAENERLSTDVTRCIERLRAENERLKAVEDAIISIFKAWKIEGLTVPMDSDDE